MRCVYFNGNCIYADFPRPKVVAIDLDGTILKYSGWKGQKHFESPLPGVKEALLELKRRGYIIVVWTTRKNVRDIARYLRNHGIPFDYINENPYQPPDGSNKIYADVYVDDRAVSFTGNWQETLQEILKRLGDEK